MRPWGITETGSTRGGSRSRTPIIAFIVPWCVVGGQNPFGHDVEVGVVGNFTPVHSAASRYDVNLSNILIVVFGLERSRTLPRSVIL